MSVVLYPAYPVLTAHRFYVAMSALCVGVAFIGFAPTYWVPLWSGSLHIAPIVHVHGALFFGWTLFLLLQTSFVALGRTAWHRELGMAGIALASAMVCMGVLVAIHSLQSGIAAGFGDRARAFSIVPLSAMVVFAGIVTYAIANVRRSEVHKRAMLVATVSLLEAAVSRWFLVLLAPPGAIGPPTVSFTVTPGLVSNLLIVAAMLYDWRTRERPHVVYVVGLSTLLAVQTLRVPASGTATWLAIADWLARGAS